VATFKKGPFGAKVEIETANIIFLEVNFHVFVSAGTDGKVKLVIVLDF
jgi:hypothetical protein